MAFAEGRFATLAKALVESGCNSPSPPRFSPITRDNSMDTTEDVQATPEHELELDRLWKCWRTAKQMCLDRVSTKFSC